MRERSVAWSSLGKSCDKGVSSIAEVAGFVQEECTVISHDFLEEGLAG